MSRAPVPRLMVITDPRAPGGVVACVREALREVPSGCPVPLAVQLRDKGASARQLVGTGRALREVTRELGATLLVNRRVDVAKVIEADGVHLPETGLSVEDVRRVLGADALVGCSCHDAGGLERAQREGADYATLSPLYAVPSKGPALGPERFSEIASAARLRILALGGIGAEQVGPALDAGAFGVAVVRAVQGAADPAAALADLLRILDRPRAEGE